MKDNIYPSWCPVCKKPVQVSKYHSAATTDTTFVAKCHGSTDQYVVTYPHYLLNEFNNDLDDWRLNLFKSDLNPDVMLAIRYGQGLI